MSVTIIATPGASDANSYLTLTEAQTYFTTRLPIAEWTAAADPSLLLVMATRTLDALLAPRRLLVRSTPPYYRTFPAWTGLPASATQALSWPRIGMYDRNGNTIATNVIPQALKNATAEFAGQLAKGDRTLDNDVSAQGVTSVKAGSVAVSFKDSIDPKPLPDAVFNLLVPSWLTDELIEQAWPALFDVVSG